MNRILAGLMLFLAASASHALTEGRLLGQSSSGQTVVFNLGTHDGVKEGEYAVIVKPIRPLDVKDLRLIPAAKARTVKVSTDSSIWILYHIYDPELFVKGQQFIVLTESNVLAGRRSLEVGRTVVVGAEDDPAKTAKEALSGDKDRLSKLKDKYQVMAETHGKEVRSAKDFDLMDVEGWKKNKDGRHRTALYRSSHADEFRKGYKLENFHELVAGYLTKVNDPEFSYETFYAQQMRDKFSNEFKAKSDFSVYEGEKAKETARSAENAKLYRSLLEKGESWSEDFSDEELRKTLKSVSVLQEKDRRRAVISSPDRYSVNVDYGFAINNNQTDKDPRYERQKVFAVNVDFEMTPFLKHKSLERFTLNGGARMNNSAFESGGSNANLNEMSLSVGLNWYPLNAPYLVQSPLPFLGTYVRSGYGSVEAPVTGDSGKYTVFSLPGFRGGVKYNFRNKVGLRIVASMETLQLARYESNRTTSTLPDETTLVEAKLAFGLSYSF